jgi:hypothetical protein
MVDMGEQHAQCREQRNHNRYREPDDCSHTKIPFMTALLLVLRYAAYQRDCNVHSYAGGDPDADVSGGRSDGSAHCSAEGDGKSQRSCVM